LGWESELVQREARLAEREAALRAQEARIAAATAATTTADGPSPLFIGSLFERGPGAARCALKLAF
jgi:hypothetical protein